jgi:hypothetical protein
LAAALDAAGRAADETLPWTASLSLIDIMAGIFLTWQRKDLPVNKYMEMQEVKNSLI